MAGFLQTDVQISSRLTLMFGGRGNEAQHNVADYGIHLRVLFAYAPGQATVIRGGGGIFHRRVEIWVTENQLRLDGTRQFEIVIDNPSYPDAFASGTLRQTFPSVRVTDPNLDAPVRGRGDDLPSSEPSSPTSCLRPPTTFSVTRTGCACAT